MSALLEESPNVKQRTSLAIVVPCYNELESITNLKTALRKVVGAFGDTIDVEIVIVDDGSQDGTLEGLRSALSDWNQVQLIAHVENQGIAAAVLTGMYASTSDVVCALDADCSFDPSELQKMFALLSPDVDVVTASPYHPNGQVLAVRDWRITLSRFASIMYRFVFRNQLFTYTSCCRVYRRECLEGLQLKHRGFVGITELLWKLDQKGCRIAEYPATLRSRTTGASKMRVLRVAGQHALFWCRAAVFRWLGLDMRSF
jgi:dolichol-phosphate mannosyltransferase